MIDSKIYLFSHYQVIEMINDQITLFTFLSLFAVSFLLSSFFIHEKERDFFLHTVAVFLFYLKFIIFF